MQIPLIELYLLVWQWMLTFISSRVGQGISAFTALLLIYELLRILSARYRVDTATAVHDPSAHTLRLIGEWNGKIMTITVELLRVISDHGAKVVKGVGRCGTQQFDLVIKFPGFNDDVTRIAEREHEAWKRLKHPNVHELVCACVIANSVPFPLPLRQIVLVSLFMHNGTITQYIAKNKMANRWKLLLDLVRGLHYLHTVAMIVHGDIKLCNILIDDEGRAKWTDFGLSTTVPAGSIPTAEAHRARGTLAYQAPELVNDEAVNASEPDRVRSKTPMSDIFAFGMVVFLLCGGKLPEPEARCMWQYNIAKGKLPARPAECCDIIWEIITKSWAYDPRQRPTAADILQLMTRHGQPADSAAPAVSTTTSSDTSPSTVVPVSPVSPRDVIGTLV